MSESANPNLRKVIILAILTVVATLGIGLTLSGDYFFHHVYESVKPEASVDAEPVQRPMDETVPDPKSVVSPLEEFTALADRIEKSSDPYVGVGALPELLAHLQTGELAVNDRINVRAGLTQEHLRLGSVDLALDQINLAITDVEQAGGLSESTAELLRIRALVHLRKAELQNCVERHNSDCCIFPLQGGAIHTVREPAEQAREDLLAYLELTPPLPNNPQRRQRVLSAIWLLNIVYMALGEYPASVPAKYLLPPKAFESENDIGRFVDIAPDLGIDSFDHAGGVIVDDFDNDGLMDIVSSTCAVRGPMKAFRNKGEGTFENVSAAWHLDEQLGGLNIVSVDYNNDGWLDIFVARGAWLFETGEIRNSLLRNDSGNGFTDVTRDVGLLEPVAPSQAVVWADFDNDGWLDVYVANESTVETSKTPRNYPSTMYRNNGNGTFTDVTVMAGVANHRYGKGVAAGDYDNDGDMDLYVSNLGRNRLYRNEGNMRFTDVSLQAGVEEPRDRSFATWFFDYDNDGWLDIWVCGYGGSPAELAAQALGFPDRAVRPCLYRNNRNGTFTDVAKNVGLSRAFLPMGANFGDFDNDGWLDMYLGTGDPSYESIMPNAALRNDGGKRFQEISKSAGLGHLQKGHGIAFVDIDNDGDQDIYHQLGAFYPGDAFHNALYMNPGQGNHFIAIELEGVKSNRMAVGARVKVTIETPGGLRELHRAPGCVSSFGGSPRRLEVGLGDATAIQSIEIFWPKSGERQTFSNVPIDSFVRIIEGDNAMERLSPPKVDLMP